MKINSITIDSSHSITDLCKLGTIYPTDKSPYCHGRTPGSSGHRHPYTAIYDFLFSSLRFKNIKIFELGILDNMSMICWREYFPNASLYGFEFNLDKIENAKGYNLKNTSYHLMDIKDASSIESGFKIAGNFDIIFEDSTHEFEDQIRFINIAYKYLNPGGIMVIEDIFKRESETNYAKALEPLAHHFSSMTFINADHQQKYSGDWDNDKLLILFKGG